MSTEETRRRMMADDMIEMQELLRDREYEEAPGRILLPQGY